MSLKQSSNLRGRSLVAAGALVLLAGGISLSSAQPPVPVDPESPPPVRLEKGPAFYLNFTGEILSAGNGRIDLELSAQDRRRFETDQVKLKITEDTKIVLNKEPAKLSELKPDDKAKIRVFGGDPVTALEVTAARITETVPAANESTRPRETRRRRTSGAIETGARGEDVLWQGRVFIAPLSETEMTKRDGYRPGDMVLFVGPRHVLRSENELPRVRVIRTGQRAGFVFESFRPDEGRGVAPRANGDVDRIRRSTETEVEVEGAVPIRNGSKRGAVPRRERDNRGLTPRSGSDGNDRGATPRRNRNE